MWWELLRFSPCSTLLLQLNVRKHLLLMLGRAHHTSRPTTSTAHLWELIVKGVLRRYPAWLLLLLDTSYWAHTLLWDWRHSLSWGLRCWGLCSTRRRGTRCGSAIVPW